MHLKTEIPKTAMPVGIPGLSHIPEGNYFLGVPIKDGKIQVGFRGKPEGFDRLNVVAGHDTVQIARASGQGLQVESPGLHQADGAPPSQTRVNVFREPVTRVTYNKVDGHWMVEDGSEVASRVGLVRFTAKATEAAIKKSKHK